MGWNQVSKWIWADVEQSPDNYAEFFTSFEKKDDVVSLKISADSNYTVFVNGVFVNSGQYPDFPHYKVYDELDISDFCVDGINNLGIVVWYYGADNFSYYPGNAALRFEVTDNVDLLAFSGPHIRSRLSKTYHNGRCKWITSQLGFGFAYDSTREDNWLMGELCDFAPSRIVEQKLELYPRPIKKLDILPRVESKLMKHEGNRWLFDLGREEVGYLTVSVQSPCTQKLTISYGEHIADGWVRRLIGPRDFSVEVVVGPGETEYTNYFRRLGLRYLEVQSEADLVITYASVLPTVYPQTKIPKKLKNPLYQKIYDTSVRTLELCMHDHYEDCPWREQGLYAMDSRNQLLCGYYAFKGHDFQRANLYLFSQDRREDDLLAICAPTSSPICIISFTLHYFAEVYEYCVYTGDLSLIREILPKLQSIMAAFLCRIENGLINNFKGKLFWNFYEWMPGLVNSMSDPNNQRDEPITEAALNCLLSIALMQLQKMCDMLGVKATYGEIAKSLNENIRKTFFDEEKGIITNRVEEPIYSELVNAWAVLCGAVQGEEAEQICDILASENDMIRVTLSMVCFKYDALLKVNPEKYKDYILQDIMNRYTPMLEADATSFWETEDGEKAFANAGSLCHGWSGMPVYYFNKLLGEDIADQ